MRREDDDIERLLGPTDSGDRDEEEAASLVEDSRELMGKGVTISWLMMHFRMDRITLKKRLARCPTIGSAGNNNPRFDLKVAASYLVQPKMDMAEWIRTQRIQDLPSHIQETYWAALLKKQRWEENAGELWRTVDVMDVLSEVFKIAKTEAQLFPDNLELKVTLKAEQRKALVEGLDGMLNAMHGAFLEMAKQRSTPSQRASLGDEEELKGPIIDDDEPKAPRLGRGRRRELAEAE